MINKKEFEQYIADNIRITLFTNLIKYINISRLAIDSNVNWRTVKRYLDIMQKSINDYEKTRIKINELFERD